MPLWKFPCASSYKGVNQEKKYLKVYTLLLVGFKQNLRQELIVFSVMDCFCKAFNFITIQLANIYDGLLNCEKSQFTEKNLQKMYQIQHNPTVMFSNVSYCFQPTDCFRMLHYNNIVSIIAITVLYFILKLIISFVIISKK